MPQRIEPLTCLTDDDLGPDHNKIAHSFILVFPRWMTIRCKIMTVLIAQAVSGKYDQVPFQVIYCSLWSLQLTLSRFVAFYLLNKEIFQSLIPCGALKKLSIKKTAFRAACDMHYCIVCMIIVDTVAGRLKIESLT